MVKKNKLKVFFIVVLLTLNTFSLMAVDRSDYDSAYEMYKNDQNEEALKLFEQFITDYPDSVKTDDALWFMGRLYRRLNDDKQAALLFKKVLAQEDSNRYEEAAYDLAKIYYYDQQYPAVLEITGFIDNLDQLGTYHMKGLELRSRALYWLALREKIDYNENDSIDLFQEAISGYKRLEPLYTDKEDLSSVHLAMAKIHDKLSDMTYSVAQYNDQLDNALQYARLALPSLIDTDKADAEKLISDIEQNRKVGFSGKIIAYAGLDNLSAGTFGGEAYGSATLEFPTAGRSSLELGVSFKHDSYDFVTSNFDPAKTGDTRLLQYTETIKTDFNWRSGTIRNVSNKLNIFGDFQFAEDTRDNYISTGLSDSGSVRFNKQWRFLWDSQFEYRTYPNYLIAGRKLDYISGSVDPEIRLYALDWMTVSLIYGLEIKQYLQSKYHVDVAGTASTLDKMYLYNSGELIFDMNIGKVYNPIVSYKFKYQKSYNYDYVVTEFNGDDFVKDYYDNMSHTFSFDNNFYFGERLTVFLDSSLSLTNFVNYIARDMNDTYLPNNELRKDLTIHLDLGANYIFWTSPKGLEIEGRLAGWWDYKSSNMTYNTTFTTNYSFAGIMLGMSVKLP
ncbi:MAG: hypothetical protein PF518_02970 [Spirochaetaceae bacterium]|jgi:hypothetical protein|nr:hypothetical protein [Spirochaetaceae bacterium]